MIAFLSGFVLGCVVTLCSVTLGLRWALRAQREEPGTLGAAVNPDPPPVSMWGKA